MQFTLRTLLVLFVAVAATLAVGGPLAIVGLIYVIALVVSIRLAVATRSLGMAFWAGFLLLIGLAVFGCYYANVVCARPVSRRSVCYGNMALLRNAVFEYHAEHGSFPPAYVTDPDGKSLYSWRVLMLPYVGCDYLYQAYHLDKPWDSPHNRKLAEKMPVIFLCPTACDFHEQDRITTDYVAVV
ncbi:MAG: DUF1559 domain-containing protein, partial [Pirellulales bacterium]|nr:DUF1559 domain-containing protein [Pirellulales bacterium]